MWVPPFFSSSVTIGEVQACVRGGGGVIAVAVAEGGCQYALRYIRLWCEHARASHRTARLVVESPGEAMARVGKRGETTGD